MEKENALAKASFHLTGVLARNSSSTAKVKWNWVGFFILILSSSIAENTHKDRRDTAKQYQGWDGQQLSAT